MEKRSCLKAEFQHPTAERIYGDFQGRVGKKVRREGFTREQVGGDNGFLFGDFQEIESVLRNQNAAAHGIVGKVRDHKQQFVVGLAQKGVLLIRVELPR